MGFLADFKSFAFKGNVIDLAVGVVIGGAFGKIVSALVADIVMPMVAIVLPSGDWRTAVWQVPVGSRPTVAYGDLLGAVLDFLVVALVLFIVVSRVFKAIEKRIAPEAPKEKTTKDCPFCFETISIKATRCKACTSQLETKAA
jgi:large conductance mechanosensitive channel